MNNEIDIKDQSQTYQWRRGFWSLFVLQFQGAFSDSVFKFLIVFLITQSITEEVLQSEFPVETAQTIELSESVQKKIEAKRDPLISTILIIFATPMILFAMAAGFLSDKYPKSRVIFLTKVAEIFVMAAGTICLYFQFQYGLLVVLFLMAVQSSFFSPAKSGVIPEMLPTSKLSWGNGIVGLGTFVAIITGGIAAGFISDRLGPEKAWSSGVILVVLAVLGTIASLGLPKLQQLNPEKKFRLNFLKEVWTNIRLVKKDRVLSLSIAGSVYFWFLAALFGEPTLFVYGKDLLELNDSQISFLRGFLAIGIAIGCLLAGFLSGKRIEYGLIPIGSVGLTLTSALMGLPNLSLEQVSILLCLLGVSGGFFIVPINSLVQYLPAPENRGTIIATERWLTAAGVLLASIVFFLLKTWMGMSPTQIFLLGAMATLLATVYAIKLMPDALIRMFLLILTRTFYRVRVKGIDNLPDRSGALLVANHLSFADACFLIASTHHHIRFVMHRKMYNVWWIYPFAKMLKAIPIASEMRPREMMASLNKAGQRVREGELVCLFAEGQIGRFGQTLPFRKGMNRILKGIEAPIIPVHLDNVWGSIFSFERGRYFFKIPRKIPYSITVNYGIGLPPVTPPHLVRKAVVDLGADSWEERKSQIPTIPNALIYTARRHKFRKRLSESGRKPMRFSTMLRRIIELQYRLKPVLENQIRVGIIAPTSLDGLMLQWTVMMMGRIPVNLGKNWSNDELADAIKTCKISIILSAYDEIPKEKIPNTVSIFPLSDFAQTVTYRESMRSWILNAGCPSRLLESVLLSGQKKPSIDDVANINFSRGRAGKKKAVQLTHYNLVSNIQQLNQVFSFRNTDKILADLPLSHVWGSSISSVLPAVLGTPVHYKTSSSDSQEIGRVVSQERITILFTTPELLSSFVKGLESPKFGSLRTVIVGGDPMTRELASEFREKFGLYPFEAYGCAECSPGVSVNIFDFRASGLHQVGNRTGSVGRGLPGLALKIGETSTLEDAGFDNPGILMVKGPNVMQGYVGPPEETEKVMKDGWFITEDLAKMDEDGFVTFLGKKQNTSSTSDRPVN